MAGAMNLDQAYVPASDVLSHDVDGELFVLPLRLRADGSLPGVFALNSTGRAVWELLDGCRSLREIAYLLSQQYGVPISQVEQEVGDLMGELLSDQVLEVTPGAVLGHE